jgi:peptidoglycan/LPS O-acetylase OafA/YrhL
VADEVVIRADSLGKNETRLEHIDMLRGCAAVLVMAGHLRSYVFTNFGSLSEPGILVKLFYGITGLGHQAVIIFFAMSGFLVGGKALEQMLSKRWYWPSYILRRLSRLWIVIVPALLATFVLDQIGMALSGGFGYDGSLYNMYASGPNTDHPINYDISTFLGNLAFVQTIWVPIFGSNTPIWSLANEFWYYLIFPLAASLVLVQYRPQMRLLAATLLVASVFVLPWELLQAGAIWIAGAVAAWLGKQPRVAPVLRYTSIRLLSLALAATAVVLTKAPGGGGDLILGMAIALWLPVIAMLPTCGKFYRLCASGAADISYTLYLTHFPLLTLVIMIGFAPHRFPPSSTGAVVYLGLFILAIAWAMAFWWCFERHTDRLFHYVNARLPLRAVGTRAPSAVSPI